MRGNSPIAKELVLEPGAGRGAASRSRARARCAEIGACVWRSSAAASASSRSSTFALYFIDYASLGKAWKSVCTVRTTGIASATPACSSSIELPWVCAARRSSPHPGAAGRALEEIPALGALAAKMTCIAGGKFLMTPCTSTTRSGILSARLSINNCWSLTSRCTSAAPTRRRTPSGSPGPSLLLSWRKPTRGLLHPVLLYLLLQMRRPSSIT